MTKAIFAILLIAGGLLGSMASADTWNGLTVNGPSYNVNINEQYLGPVHGRNHAVHFCYGT